MKKLIALLLALVMILSMAACAATNDKENDKDDDKVNNTDKDDDKDEQPDPPASDSAMTHAEFLAAEDDAPVEVLCYVQATQAWWDGKVVIYAQDATGGYFAYNVSCTKEEADQLVPGTCIRIKGFKTFYKGMPEIAEGATFTVEETTYIAPVEDMTSLLGTPELVNKAGMKAAFKGLTIAKIEYKNGEPGDDIYVDFTLGDATYSFSVERYLTDPETEVYKAFAELQVGDVVDVEGFVYWYDADEDGSGDGINTHITSVKAAEFPVPPSLMAMTHAEYMAAEEDEPVVVECYVQATQSWWDDKIVIYAQDQIGGYFAYNAACSKEVADKLVPGTKVRIEGYKTFYKGMPEIAEGATVTILENEDPYIAYAEIMTDLLGSPELVNKAGVKAAFQGLTISKIEYKNGEPGDDIYVTVAKGDNTYEFCVERYLTDPETDVYKAFADLQAGDQVDIQGFVYWYDADEDGSGNGINTHITMVTKVG